MARHAVLLHQLMSHLNAILDLLLQLFLHLGNNYLPAKRHQILLLFKWNRTWYPGATDFNLQVHMVFLADKTGLKGSQNASSSCPCWGEPWKTLWGLLIEYTHRVFCNKSWIIISSPNTAHGWGGYRRQFVPCCGGEKNSWVCRTSVSQVKWCTELPTSLKSAGGTDRSSAGARTRFSHGPRAPAQKQ